MELFPFAERARGIAVEQFFGRGAGFFSTYVNAIALKAITWKYLAVYCGWIAIEVMFVYFFYPETQGRTLEELAFCKLSFCIEIHAFPLSRLLTSCAIVFEDKALADNVVVAVEKQIHYEDTDFTKQEVTHVEETAPKL